MNPDADNTDEPRQSFIKKPGFNFSAAAEVIVTLGMLADSAKKLRDEIDIAAFIRATEDTLRENERPRAGADPEEERKRVNVRKRGLMAVRLAKAALLFVEAYEATEA